jgi:G6PDH family F420-dependent oxidoreductase
VRIEMLEEAIDVIRQLWQGGVQSHWGKHYTVENARIYTLPDPLPPIFVAASGPEAARRAGRLGDGLITTSPQPEVVQEFQSNGGSGKPSYGQVTCCWASSEAEARRIAFEYWPTAAITGELSQELPTPTHFEQAARMVTEDDVAQMIVCGPDPQRHLERIQKYVDAGLDHIYVHQVGPDQKGFMDFYRREILPPAQRMTPSHGALRSERRELIRRPAPPGRDAIRPGGVWRAAG